VTESAVVTEDPVGRRTEHGVDTIIFGTGFRVSDPPVAERVFWADGCSLTSVWAQEGMAAFHGVTLAGFPDLFLLVGPNTGLGHTSIAYLIEVAYLLDGLETRAEHGLSSVLMPVAA